MRAVPTALLLVLLLTFAACGSESAAPCDECTPANPDVCLQGACGSVCGSLDINDCLEAFPDMTGRILGCVDACDGCDTGLSCGPCSGPACPPQGEAPPFRCAAFNGTTRCGVGALYTGSNG
jgi:hypothetical protein